MIVKSRLLSRLLRHPEPGSDGSGSTAAVLDAVTAPAAAPAEPSAAPAPAADTPAPPAPAPAPAAKLADPLDGLRKAMDAVGQPEPAAADRNPDGTFKTPAPVEAKAPATPAATPAPTQPKPDDLTPPEGMNERAKARWDALTERVKTHETQVKEVTESLNSVRALVNESGLAPHEFTDMLDMAKSFKSNDPQAMQRALTQLEGLRSDVARRLGVEVPGVDLLDKHPDLKADVDGMLMTRERALEIANLRGKNAQSESVQREQQEMQQHQATVRQASAAMDAELSRRANTPGHQQRLNAIGAYFAKPENMKAFVTTYEPKQWDKVLGLMYDNIQIPAAAAAPAGPQPLRAQNVRAGTGVPNGPMTAGSAVMSAFDAAGL